MSNITNSPYPNFTGRPQSLPALEIVPTPSPRTPTFSFPAASPTSLLVREEPLIVQHVKSTLFDSVLPELAKMESEYQESLTRLQIHRETNAVLNQEIMATTGRIDTLYNQLTSLNPLIRSPIQSLSLPNVVAIHQEVSGLQKILETQKIYLGLNELSLVKEEYFTNINKQKVNTLNSYASALEALLRTL